MAKALSGKPATAAAVFDDPYSVDMFGLGPKPSKPFADEVAMVVAMGFPEDAARRAVEGARGDVQRAVAALTAPPPAAASAAAPPPAPSLEATCADAAARLARASDVHARAVASFLRDLADAPNDARLKVVLTGGRGALQEALRSGDNAGVELLVAAGYRRHDASTLALGRPDPARVFAARSALEAAAGGSPGRAAREDRRRASENAERRALCAASFRNVSEPAVGGAGVAVVTCADAAGAKFATRRFDGDDTLERVVRFLATCDVGPPRDLDGARGWRLVEGKGAPCWWCDAWRLRDAQSPPDRPTLYGADDVAKTLTHLKIWPSVTLVVEPWDALVRPKASPRPPAVDDLRGGRRLGAKPKPSDMFKRTGDRFAKASPLAGAGDRKAHYNIAKSADKVPGLPQLLSMGFDEAKARAALKRHAGDVDAAVGELLAAA